MLIIRLINISTSDPSQLPVDLLRLKALPADTLEPFTDATDNGGGGIFTLGGGGSDGNGGSSVIIDSPLFVIC